MVAVKTKAIGKQFTTTAGPLPVLEDITLSVKSGEIMAIVGKSGSGKSTLLNIISCK